MFPTFAEPLAAIFVFPVKVFSRPKCDNTNLHCDNIKLQFGINRTALGQSELRNFFMYIINKIATCFIGGSKTFGYRASRFKSDKTLLLVLMLNFY